MDDLSTGPQTCLHAKPDRSEEIAITTKERTTWFSDISEGGFQLTYKADSTQITFLQVNSFVVIASRYARCVYGVNPLFSQMLSSRARQELTYHCSNSVAYHHTRRNTYRKALVLMSWNDLEIRHRGKFSYDVVTDGCKVSTST